ncbi:hypothetical protein DID75_02275 [Candidatus Marinamargulisbacteria bacterium SCGC AG-410-N11]|nr:hypothetical protein DID75_02275 [Candidatus Marinamargulisbacteria bacterium SCGC AG-410-N11]
MSLIKNVDRYFWVLIIIAVALGLAFPSYIIDYERFVIIILTVIMGLLFLKVDIIEILSQIKKPSQIVYISCINLILLPFFSYFIFKFLDSELLMGFVFLAALPAGVSSAVFTDMMKGKTSLNLTIIIVTNLLSAVTIPMIFLFLFNHEAGIDYLRLIKTISFIVFVPFVIAKIMKRVIFPRIIHSLQDYFNFIIISLLSVMIMIIIAGQADFIKLNIQDHLGKIAMLFLALFIFQIVSYFSVFWLKKGEKLAVANSNMIMNNILGIVIAMECFPREVMYLLILSLIPWNAMIILKHWYKRFLP